MVLIWVEKIILILNFRENFKKRFRKISMIFRKESILCNNWNTSHFLREIKDNLALIFSHIKLIWKILSQKIQRGLHKMKIICQQINKKQRSLSSKITHSTGDQARMWTVGAISLVFLKVTVLKDSPSSSSLLRNRISPTPRTPNPLNTQRTTDSHSKCACSKTTPSPICPPIRLIPLPSSSNPCLCPCPSHSSIPDKTTSPSQTSQSLETDPLNPAHSTTHRGS